MKRRRNDCGGLLVVWALVICLVALWPSHAAAQLHFVSGPVSIEISNPVGATCRRSWGALVATVENHEGRPLEGDLVISGLSDGFHEVRQRVALPARARVDVHFLVPPNWCGLRASYGEWPARRRLMSGESVDRIQTGDADVLILLGGTGELRPAFSTLTRDEGHSGWGAMSRDTPGTHGSTLRVAQLRLDSRRSAMMLPEFPHGYAQLMLVVADPPALGRLPEAQRRALASWVRTGGSLAVVASDESELLSNPVVSDLLPGLERGQGPFDVLFSPDLNARCSVSNGEAARSDGEPSSSGPGGGATPNEGEPAVGGVESSGSSQQGGDAAADGGPTPSGQEATEPSNGSEALAGGAPVALEHLDSLDLRGAGLERRPWGASAPAGLGLVHLLSVSPRLAGADACGPGAQQSAIEALQSLVRVKGRFWSGWHHGAIARDITSFDHPVFRSYQFDTELDVVRSLHPDFNRTESPSGFVYFFFLLLSALGLLLVVRRWLRSERPVARLILSTLLVAALGFGGFYGVAVAWRGLGDVYRSWGWVVLGSGQREGFLWNHMALAFDGAGRREVDVRPGTVLVGAHEPGCRLGRRPTCTVAAGQWETPVATEIGVMDLGGTITIERDDRGRPQTVRNESPWAVDRGFISFEERIYSVGRLEPGGIAPVRLDSSVLDPPRGILVPGSPGLHGETQRLGSVLFFGRLVVDCPERGDFRGDRCHLDVTVVGEP